MNICRKSHIPLDGWFFNAALSIHIWRESLYNPSIHLLMFVVKGYVFYCMVYWLSLNVELIVYIGSWKSLGIYDFFCNKIMLFIIFHCLNWIWLKLCVFFFFFFGKIKYPYCLTFCYWIFRDYLLKMVVWCKYWCFNPWIFRNSFFFSFFFLWKWLYGINLAHFFCSNRIGKFAYIFVFSFNYFCNLSFILFSVI